MSVRTGEMLAVGRKPPGRAKPYADRVQEFVDFLGKQAPYDALDAEDLERLAAHVEVEFFAKGALIIEPGADRLERLAVDAPVSCSCSTAAGWSTRWGRATRSGTCRC